MSVPLEGRLIRHWRRKRGMTMSELARRVLPNGVTHSAVWQWENGASKPSNVEAIATALGLTMMGFYGGERDLDPSDDGSPASANG